MTKPDVFYKSVLDTMEYLDSKLPNGSHVLLTGLGNGTYLYDLLANRTHPMGRLRNDITYTDFYAYLSCLQVRKPYFNFMNDNLSNNLFSYKDFSMQWMDD